jgi:hypothetical protein
MREDNWKGRSVEGSAYETAREERVFWNIGKNLLNDFWRKRIHLRTVGT